ncbi:IS1595 family transposase [Persicobacter sp. CCB-QB2]|uniref:IS1595 family transposase n=1 Tax=Persicobacter sp. CCB-QB2 TaxID=1561025 RepID=UPI0006A95FFC|nr:IS1595 family transposase [Persicobacter sp. CCB-QB2]
MKIFKGQDLIAFTTKFQSDLECQEYLAAQKWDHGYTCRKCGHGASQVRKNHSRTCNKCSHTESPTANTLFHKVKFGIRKAFFICFEMSTSTKSFSARYMAKRYSITEKTARMFMHKVREAMKSSEQHPMQGTVHVDEFVIGGKENGKIGRSYHTKKKKIVCALELTEDLKVKRMYSMRIKDYSSKELRQIFDRHISPNAKVTADEWRGYDPIAEDYSLTQIKSENGMNFKALHTMIHQVKSWVRTTFSWVSKKHVDRYLSEFNYRLNRSQTKETIFHNLISRMVRSEKIYQTQILCI